MKTFRRIFSKVFSLIFNRLTIVLAAIAVQLTYFIMLILRLSAYAHWVNISFRTLTVLMIAYIIWQDRNPAYKIGWIVFMALFPEVGAVLFIVFGARMPSRGIRRRLARQEALHKNDFLQVEPLDMLGENRERSTARYVAEHGAYPLWDHTMSKYYPVGEKLFDDMVEDLKKAEHFIFIEYFIISKGTLWDEIFQILKEKASQGVDIRIIYDDVGSMHKLPRHFSRQLQDAGIQVMDFNTMKPIVSLVYNNRDHRKIMVIDGYIGYSGGVNISDEYANRIVRFGHWKDTGTRIEGEAVWNYTVMFLNMWHAFRGTDEDYRAYGPHTWHPGEFPNDGEVQPFSDSPLDDENVGENVYFEMLNQAQEYVYIFTPYLILDNEMETALKLAAKRGIDVRLVIPGVPDKPLVYAMSLSYVGPLIKAGVKVYKYTPGFIHAKSFLCDGKLGAVGTINMDYRSFFLHFENSTVLYHTQSLDTLYRDCIDTFRRSALVTEKDLKKHRIGAMIGFFMRIFTPLF